MPPDTTASNYFQISVKGLFLNSEGKALLFKERGKNTWDLPGGKIESGEDLIEALQRECLEELGVPCSVTDEQPYAAWTALDKDGKWRVVLCFRVTIPQFHCGADSPCHEFDFFDKSTIVSIRLAPHTDQLKEWM
ncbi:MAG: NUDIX hydrolase [Patescibacteria group bacterium]